MMQYDTLLSGGDLRSIGRSNSVVRRIKNQHDFDMLFNCLFHPNRLVVMRASDAIEKITIRKPQYLARHAKEIIELGRTANEKELTWHLALLIPRLELNAKESGKAWHLLKTWVMDKTNSRIVRVNSLQGLYELRLKGFGSEKEFASLLPDLENENIPSIHTRIKNIRKKMPDRSSGHQAGISTR